MIRRKHMPCADCGCVSCCTGATVSISKLSFESLDGLHPVEFEDVPLRFAASGTNLSTLLNTRPPMNAGNPSCSWWASSGFTWRDEGPYSVKKLTDSNCCFGAVAAPSTQVKSPNVDGRLDWSASVDEVTTTTSKTTTSGKLCTTPGFEHTGQRGRQYAGMQRVQLIATRVIAAVSIAVCWVDVGYGVQARLTARVWYKDLVYANSAGSNNLSVIVYPNSGYWGTITTGIFPVCGTKGATSGTTTWQCGSNSPPSMFEFEEDFDVSSCFDCDTGTSPTGNNCTADFIERSIYLPSGECDITGSHLFTGANTNTPKYRVSGGCGVLDPNGNPSTHPCQGGAYNPSNCESRAPFEPSDTTTSISDVDFDERRVVVTVDEDINETRTGPTVVMNWWDEDWLISIS